MLSLTCAISEYDHARDLASGRVQPEGISLSCLIMPVEEIFFRMLRFGEFDLSEMSMGRYVSILSSGECPFVALPIFPSRMFRHSSIYIRTDGSVTQPSDLKGKRIGIPEWAQTAGIYTRGMLASQFGVALGDVEWVQAGIHEIGREEEVMVHPPAGVTLTRITDRTLNDMILTGEIDALMSAHPPECVERGDPRVGRLFEDFETYERSYWQDTGVFPIMHTILLRKDVFEANRWIAMNLLKAFNGAKQRSFERLAEVTASRIPLPWAFLRMQQVKEQFGSDFWPYGIEKNRPTLSAFLKFAFEQGVATRLMTPEELFPPEVQAQFKI